MTAFSTIRPASERSTEIAELEREIAKLRKINKALMDRVERNMDAQGSAFSLFQTAIVLEAKVRERTEELERYSREIGEAKAQAETAQARLMAALESVSEGFALFDAEDRLALFNARYIAFWPGMSDRVHVGMSFADIVRLAVERRAVIDAYRDPEHWVERRMRQHADPRGPSVHALSDGRWLQVNEKRTPEGGIVCVYTDITDLKRREMAQRETALAEKNNLLQATLDNIFEGVAVFDRSLVLVAWNNELVRLFSLPSSVVRRGAGFADFAAYLAALGASGVDLAGRLEPLSKAPLKFEIEWLGERSLEAQRNPMPGGGFVLTFADITQRKRIEQALRDGERRIRLITDAMPALISYVDAEERYRFINEPYCRWLGRSEESIVGRRMTDVLPPEFYQWRQSYVRRALNGEGVTFEVELTPPGTPEPAFGLATFVPHVGEDRRILGFFALLQDITERRQMKATLQRRVEERTAALTLLNEALQREIADRRAIEEALQITKSEAEQANLGKTKFLAAASHDLLQPLNAARLFVSALSEREHDKTNRQLVDNAEESLGAVEDLLGALLDISKLDAGAVSPEVIDFEIGSLLVPLTTEYTVLAAERGLRFRSVASSCVLRSDIRLLRRILQNLLANAIRYTGRGKILLGCRRTASGVRIEVWDTGTGIPAEKLEEIFEEFRQLDNPATRHERGMGLGLAIVRRIAKTLNIPVGVRSIPGRGSMFFVTVPYGTAPVALPGTCPAATLEQPLSGAVVLVIDNDRSILSGMEALLGGWDCRVHSALSGDEALRLLPSLRAPPDVVIADYHLDDGALGLTELDRISRACGRSLPAILITANRATEIQALAKQHGCRLLRKPIKPAQLRSLLVETLA